MGALLEANTNSIDALIAGGSNRWSSPYPFGTPATVTFSFMTELPSYFSGVTGFESFNDNWKGLARQALQAYADVTNLTFIEVPDSNGGGLIRFGFCNQTTTAGYAYYPSVTASSISQTGGDVFIRTGYGGSSPTTSDDAYHVLLHETGHALGLKHPGNYDAAESNSEQEPPFLSSSEDTGSNTVMSYNGDRETTLQAYDVQAIQFLYGLKSAGSVGTMTQGDDSANSMTANASGGYFQAGAGNDTFFGAAGNDGALGGSGDDYLSGAAGNDYLHAGSGNDSVWGGSGTDSLYGGQNNDQMVGDSGDDWIHGNRGDDTLYGGVGDDTLYGGQSNDTLYGGDGYDWLEGNLGDDVLYGNAGEDTFYFADSNGTDVIADFNPSLDTIYIRNNVNSSGISTSTNWSSRITNTSSGVSFDLGNGNSFLISGVSSSDLLYWPTIYLV